MLYMLHIFGIVIFAAAYGLKITPERLDLAYCNESYVVGCKATMVRYCRRCHYYFNIEGKNLHTWINNLTVHILYSELLSNKYKPSFIDVTYKFCDMLREDPLLGKLIANSGIKCPLLPGTQRLLNLTFSVENFPYVWPFKKGRLDVRISTTVGNNTVGIGYVYATFDNKPANGPPQAKKKSVH